VRHAACEPFREAIELGLRQGRNATAILADLCPRVGSAADIRASNASFRKLRGKQEPQPRAVILTAPGERLKSITAPPDGARSADKQISTHPIVLMTLGTAARRYAFLTFRLQLTDLGRAARASLPSTGWLYPYRGIASTKECTSATSADETKRNSPLDTNTSRVHQLLHLVADVALVHSLVLAIPTIRVQPPSRRKARSCSSAQIRELERKVRKRTALRCTPASSRTIGCVDICFLRIAHHRPVP